MSTPPPSEEHEECGVEIEAEAGVADEPDLPAVTSRRASRRRSGLISTGTVAGDDAPTTAETNELPLRALGTSPGFSPLIEHATVWQDDVTARKAAASVTEPSATFDVTAEAKKKRRETSQRQVENVISESKPVKLESVGESIGQQHVQKSKLKDVTNSPRTSRSMPSVIGQSLFFYIRRHALM
jgi:hypothetical protein